jgi:hypothetical protein
MCADLKEHTVKAGEQTFLVVEDGGVAAAEARGKVDMNLPYQSEPEAPAVDKTASIECTTQPH